MTDAEFEALLVGWRADTRFVEIAGRNTSWEAAASHFGVTLYEAGETAAALTAFEAACARSPAEPFNWANAGVCLSELGRDAEAVMAFQKSLVLDAVQPVVRFNLGQALGHLGRLEEARTAYEVAAESPDLAEEGVTELGLLYMRHLHYAEAVGVFTIAVRRYPHRSQLQANLGASAFQTGDLEQAASSYNKAAALSPVPGYLENSAFIKLLQALIREPQAATLERWLADNRVDDPVATLKRAVFYLNNFHHFAAAQIVVAAWQKRAPADPEANYLLSAAAGTQVPRAPADYIVRYFDAQADLFDERLQSYLQYQVPAQLQILLAEKLGEGWQGDVLDLGCGAGLAGPYLRPLARRLVGVDLSPQMLARAAVQPYDELVAGDIADLPTLLTGSFDLAVATDTLIYFGDLTAVFASIATVLKPGGWLAVSLETMPGRHYFQMPNGRFKHARNYLEQVRRAHFSLVELRDMPIRVEAGHPVPGSILLFQKRPVAANS